MWKDSETEIDYLDYENEDSWMRVPGTNRSVPIPDILHLLV